MTVMPPNLGRNHILSRAAWRRAGCPRHRDPGILPGSLPAHLIFLNNTCFRLRAKTLTQRRATTSSKLILGVLLMTVLVFQAAAQAPGAKYFSQWSPGTSPTEVGIRIAENVIPRPFRCETVPEKAALGVIYPEVIAWYGALTLARLANDTSLNDRLVSKMAPFLTEKGALLINRSAHVDYRVFGAVPLEIFLQTKDSQCKQLGLDLADKQWAMTTADGITAEARYWIDDMYMITLLQAQAFRATGDVTYLDRATLTMGAYFNRMQETNGLFHHGTDSPFFWGRGNGWMAAGAAELLRSLPESHPRHARILAGYRKMMAGLLVKQMDTGMWGQLLDEPAAWPETSATAMFTFAMVTGVKSGWLDEASYGPAARKAWLALVGYLDDHANLREVCVGTNKGFDAQYYLDRPRTTGDLHGQAPMLWSASALLR